MEYKRYSQYMDSGIEWLGELPKHWSTASMRWITERYAGGTPDKRNKDYWENGTIPWLNSGAVNQGTITEPSTYITEDAFLNSSAKWVPKRALLMALAGQGKTKGMVAQTNIRTTCNQSMAAIVPYGIIPRYLFWWLSSQYRNIRGLAGDGLRDGLNLEMLGSIPCPLPNIDEQESITTLLDHETSRIDALIEKKQRLIELLKEKRQAVITQAVTKGLDPNAPMKDSGVEWLGEVPEHWEECRLKVLFGIKHGYAFDSAVFSDTGEFILMTPGNFKECGGFRHKVPEKFYRSEEIPTEFILDPGQLLVAMTEQGPGLLGSALFVPFDGVYLHNQRLGLLTHIRDDKVSKQYLFHLFNSSRYRAEISVSSTGAKVKHTSPEKILSTKVWLPPIKEQESIAQFLNGQLAKIDSIEAKVEDAIKLLQEHRSALITAAVTGQIDVCHTA
ncbi:MAG: restriction endonuclease subunit S [Candidatus Thiodiazotropha sp.]